MTRTAETARAHTDLWGKSRGLDEPYPLLAHLLDTAAAARVVCETMIPPPMRDALAEMSGGCFEGWQAETELIAGWHDLGSSPRWWGSFDRTKRPAVSRAVLPTLVGIIRRAGLRT